MGDRMRQEAERQGMKPAQVATVFGVRAPSVYDWYQYGRIHKKHYPTLIKWSGKPLHWWLGFAEITPDGAVPAPPQVVREPVAVYPMPRPKVDALASEWIGLFKQLDDAAKIECINYMRGFVKGRRPHENGHASTLAEQK